MIKWINFYDLSNARIFNILPCQNHIFVSLPLRDQSYPHNYCIIKPGPRPACTWFLVIVFVCEVGMHVCVCRPPRLLKTIHVK